MADAYNVRTNGSVYYVYRMDGNVQVAEYMGEGAAAKAQRECAIRNQQHNERFGKKKESPEVAGTPGVVHTKPYPEPQKTQPEQPKKEVKKSTPNPPPGKGASY